MKKVVLAVAVVATFGLASCGGVDVEKAGEEFCACKDSDDKEKCLDEWVEEYKDAAGSEEDGEKLAEKMLECDPEGLTYVAPKLEE